TRRISRFASLKINEIACLPCSTYSGVVSLNSWKSAATTSLTRRLLTSAANAICPDDGVSSSCAYTTPASPSAATQPTIRIPKRTGCFRAMADLSLLRTGKRRDPRLRARVDYNGPRASSLEKIGIAARKTTLGGVAFISGANLLHGQRSNHAGVDRAVIRKRTGRAHHGRRAGRTCRERSRVESAVVLCRGVRDGIGIAP